jgi:hypothetical protein
MSRIEIIFQRHRPFLNPTTKQIRFMRDMGWIDLEAPLSDGTWWYSVDPNAEDDAYSYLLDATVTG